MTVAKTGAPSALSQQWKSYDWKRAEKEVKRLQMRIAKAVLTAGPGKQGSRVLEPCDGKLSRTVLRGEGSREAPDLPGPP